MEALLFGVMLLITFIVGLGIGLSVPFFVKKYMKMAKEESKEITEKETSNDIPYIPKDLLTEWMTGEEVKPSEQ